MVDIFLQQLRLFREVIKDLTPREQQIILYRFGITYTKTLEEAGKEFGVTRERIRQIEAIALEKLRQHYAYKSG